MILLVIVSLSGCTSNTANFTGQFISFDYPISWNMLDNSGNGSDMVYLLPDDELGDSKKVKVAIMGPRWDSSLDNYMAYTVMASKSAYVSDTNENLVNDPNYKLYKNQSVVINGLKGFDIIVQGSEYVTLGDKPKITEFIVLQNGSDYYELRLELPSELTINSTETKQYLEQFQTIANSFKLQ
jgi:hypothetical protein